MKVKLGHISTKFILAMIALLPSGLFAQNPVIMPHLGTDTLRIDRSNCYTILDPGGYSNYTNNEDSWLYVVSSSGPFRLNLSYQTGVNGDDGDYIDIYYGNDTNVYHEHYYDSGTNIFSSNSYGGAGDSCVLIHFHSNNYASFSGYEIRVEYPNSIHSWDAQSHADSSITISWLDNIAEATEWTVTYYC